MRETRVLCDRCRNTGAMEISINLERKADAAGSMGDVTLDADLCEACQAFLFRILLPTLRAKERTNEVYRVTEFLDSLRNQYEPSGSARVFIRHDP